MNGKKAKLRKAALGENDNLAKKLYNKLSPQEKETLSNFYQFVKTRKITNNE